MLKVSTVIGPVSYPIIASTMKRNDVTVMFEEDVEADVYLNAIPILGKVDLILISRMLLITPKLGKRIAVWKKGSANDLLLQLIMKLYSMNSEVIYTENPNEVYQLLSSGKADSAMVTVGITRDGIVLEDLFKEKGLQLPGICGAKVVKGIDDFSTAYKEGLDLFKEDPEGVSEYVMDNLPVPRPSMFIRKMIENAEYKVERLSFDFHEFERSVENNSSKA